MQYFTYEEVKAQLHTDDEDLERRIGQRGIQVIEDSGRRLLRREDVKDLQEDMLGEKTLEGQRSEADIEQLYADLVLDDYFAPLLKGIERELYAQVALDSGSISTTDATSVLPRSDLPGQETQVRREQAFTGLDLIGGYRILRSIGEGTSAVVYLCEGQDGVRHALKKLKKTVSEQETHRFIKSAQILKKMKHKGLVSYKEIGYCGQHNTLFLVMEYVEGKNLKEYVEAQTIPEEKALQIAGAIAETLDYLEKQGVVHRDIKPANILMTSDLGTIKLVDMGLAKSLEEGGMSLTFSYQVLGTVLYMSLEQALSSKNVDIRSDIYALGATLYHILAGRPPYCEIRSAVEIVAAKRSKKEPQPLRSLNPAISKKTEEVVRTAMKIEPDKRYRSPRDMAHAIEEARKALGR